MLETFGPAYRQSSKNIETIQKCTKKWLRIAKKVPKKCQKSENLVTNVCLYAEVVKIPTFVLSKLYYEYLMGVKINASLLNCFCAGRSGINP